MAFLINTSGVVTLADLGNRILTSGLSNFDLGAEYRTDELRYSDDLIAAIEAGTLEVVDDGKGRSITGPVSNAVATAFVEDIFHYDDTDVQGALGTLDLADIGDVTITGNTSGELLQWTGSAWENQTVGSESGVQAYDLALDNLSALAGTGIMVQTAADTFVVRSIAEDSTNAITIANGDAVSGNPTISVDAGLDSIAGLTTAAGSMIYTTALDTYATLATTAFGRGLLNETDAASTRTTLDIYSKAEADALLQGLSWKQAVRVATTTTLPANTAAGSGVGKTLTADAVGVLTIDGVATVLGDRILVKNEGGGASDVDNGIYEVTTEGTAGVPFVLTRATDTDGSPASEMDAASAFVTEGTTNGDTAWAMKTDSPTVDTTALEFIQFSNAATIYTASNGVTLSTNDFQLDLNSVTGGTISLATDSMVFIDSDGNVTRKVAMAEVINDAAGNVTTSGLSSASGVLTLDINGLTADTSVGATDTLAIYDGANKKITFANFEASLSLANLSGQIDLTTDVTGVLPVANGGTGAATLTANGLLVGNGTGAVTSVTGASAGEMLIWDQTAGTWDVANISGTASRVSVTNGDGTVAIDIDAAYVGQTSITTLGTIATGTWNGTEIGEVYGGTGQTSYTTGDLLYASGADTLSKLAAGTAGQILEMSGGVPVWTTPTASKKSWSWGASSSSNSNTNRYLDRHDGVATNQSPFVAWFNCELRAIALSTSSASTWTAEVHVNGVSAGTLASAGSQYANTSGLTISISAGDRVSFYVNGTGVSKPSIDALFEEV